jgi:extradiol dioxygenase family protein
MLASKIVKRSISKSITPFHLAFPVTDLEKTRHFYRNVLGCPQGRVLAYLTKVLNC